jgi:CBS domain-containing membrane protein
MTDPHVDSAGVGARSIVARLLALRLSGATVRDRVAACFGALLGIGGTALSCGLAFRGVHFPVIPFIVAPMGASAVLLFAVPASPLAQPWSIIGGNTISALVGITVVHFIADPLTAAAVAVALAIGAMSLMRCLHPPGGAAALTAVLGGPVVLAAGYKFAFIPVGLNSALLVLIGWLFHKLSRRHAYPHVAPPVAVNLHGTADAAPLNRLGFRAEDVDKALEDIGETLDVDRGDIDHLLRRVELHALSRVQGDLTCADIMSRDIVHVSWDTTPSTAQRLLLTHSVRTLPVVDDRGRVLGCVGLPDLVQFGGHITDIMTAATIASLDGHVFELVDQLTDGHAHAVIIVDDQNRLIGMVTQTDLLVALSRSVRTFGPCASASPQRPQSAA